VDHTADPLDRPGGPVTPSAAPPGGSGTGPRPGRTVLQVLRLTGMAELFDVGTD